MAKRPTQTNTPSQPTNPANPSQNVIGATARHDVYEKGLGNRPDLGSEYWGNTEFAEGAVGIPMSPVLNSFRTLTIGDKSVPLSNAVGQTFDTQYGKLTVTGYDTRTGALSYRYELTTNVYDQPNATESDLVTIRVQNYKGGATECLVQFDIIDDTPDARNDTDTVKSGTWVEKGNVISGDGTNEGLSGAGADTKGADGARVTHIVSKTNTEKSVSSNGETEIKGEYGTLKIKADGSYTYTRDYNTKGGVEDVFTYTLTDGDTDADKATLTIKIDDFTPVLTLTDVNVAVDEDDLSNGSDTSKESVAVSKSFSFTSWDGVSSLTVQLDNGTEVEVFKNGAFQSNKEIVTPHGTLKFTGGTWDPANGKGTVSYTYTLTDDLDHTNGNGENTFVENYTVKLKDVDGDAAAQQKFTVTITDDVPDAKNDTDTVKSGTWVEKGNVITGEGTNEGLNGAGADVKGADDAAVALIESATVAAKAVSSSGETDIAGQYGTLKIAADGSYTYTRDAGTPGNVDDVFTYTLKDGDGDTDAAKLTIKIDDFTPVLTLTGADVAVDEDDLSGGSDTSKESVVVSKSFSFTSWDGVSSLKVQLGNGTEVEVLKNGAFQSGKEIVTSHGTLKFTGGNYDAPNGTGTVNYTYTLTDNLAHTNGNGENTLVENYTVKLEDADGDPATQQNFTVTITDDVPDAKDDTDTVKVGTQSETGNVITGEGTNETKGGAGTDVKGADGAAVTQIESATGGTKAVSTTGTTEIAGQYGKLKIDADGSYTYTRNAGTPGNVDDVFTYTLKDGDGDADTAKLTIKIENGTPVLSLTAANIAVDEDDLSNGSDTQKELVAVSKSFSFTSWDGVSSLKVQLGNGTEVEVLKNGAFQSGKEIVTSHGTLKFTGGNYDAPNGTGTVNYTYTLTDNLAHTNGNGENTLVENYTVKLEDADGDPAVQQKFTVTITDDIPEVAILAADNDDTVAESATVSGKWKLIEGADGVTVGAGGGLTVTIDGEASSRDITYGQNIVIAGKGTLTFNAPGLNNEGTWTFQAADDVDPTKAELKFTINVLDTDGDPDSDLTDNDHTITITQKGPVPGVLVVGSNDGDKTGTTTEHTVVPPSYPTDKGRIDGTNGDDLLVGDPGGFVTTQGKTVNVAFVLDTSGSMGNAWGGSNRLTLLQSAVNKVIDDLSTSGATAVKLYFTTFSGTSDPIRETSGEFGTSQTDNAQVATTLKQWINNLTAQNLTNYEIGLQKALGWIGSSTPIQNADLNKVIFISDGAPNQGQPADEISALHATAYVTETVSFDAGPSAIVELDKISTNPEGTYNISSPSELDPLIGILAGSSELALAGNDELHGGDGVDIIFGDVLFTDDVPGSLLPDGSGWKVFTALGWTQDEIEDYISTNHVALSKESGRGGGHDVIFGGAGNDIIYGQEGNDEIHGGLGNDTLTGGTGADTFVFEHVGAGNKDLITDYDFTQGDKIDLTALLTGVVTSGAQFANHVEWQRNGNIVTLSIKDAANNGVVVDLADVPNGETVRLVVDSVTYDWLLTV